MNKTKIVGLSILLITLFSTNCFATTEELKIHEESKTVSIENIEEYKNNIEKEIEINNTKYQLEDIEQIENKETIKIDKEEIEGRVVFTNNKYDVLQSFESKKEMTEDGATGILELQNDSLEIKAKDSYKEQYKVSIVKKYENVSSNELNDIPKTIEENGTTYYLINPIWDIAQVEKIDGQYVPILYKGEMYYEGIKDRTIIKSYIAEVKYKGILEKEEIKSVTFNISYKEMPKEERTNYIPIVAATGTGIIFVSGIILWKRKKKKISQ